MPARKKQNILQKLIPFITYKEKQQVKSFVIPEIGEVEKSEQPQNQDAQNQGAQDQNAQKQNTQKQDAQKQNVPNQDAQNQDTQDQNTQNQNAQNKNSQNQCTQKQDDQNENAQKQDAPDQKTQNQNTPKQKIFKTNKRRIVKKPTPIQDILAEQADENKKVDDEKAKSNKNTNNKNTGNKNVISTNIDDNIDFIKSEFNFPLNIDIVIRDLLIGKKHKAFIVYIEGMVDRKVINDSIIRPLVNEPESEFPSDECLSDHLFYSVLETNQNKKVSQPQKVISELLAGNTGIYIDGCDNYILCETKGFVKRNVEKPQVEGAVKGSQEAFTEDLCTNRILIRRSIKNKNLTTEILNIGDKNNCLCAVMYLKGVVNPAIVNEVKRRLNGIKTDFLLGDGYIEQFIEDTPRLIIPTILSTERPDRTASHILDGKVAILSEGTPFALLAPITLFTLLHTPEDTALKWQFGTMLRLIRLFAVFISIFLPGVYVAMTNFHKEMIPTDLLIAIASARENVPFPTIFEVLMMELAFELIREAGIRIPGIIGNTIGIIGALIIGQAAVQADLVSPVLIIVVAFTGLGNFAIPDFNLAFTARVMRLVFIILGSVLGFFGISLGLIISSALLVNLKSFGVPMFTGIAPKTRWGNGLILRSPLWKQELRPDELNPVDIRRQPEVSRQWDKKAYDFQKVDNKEKGGEKSND